MDGSESLAGQGPRDALYHMAAPPSPPLVERFRFQGRETVRLVLRDGAPWFVASDVCGVLGIVNHRDAIGALDPDERGQSVLPTPGGGAQPTNLVSEAGLYTLILRCRKPRAVSFRRWVTHEVLPKIARTGEYRAPQAPAHVVPQSFAEALRLAATLEEERAALSTKVAVLAPKAAVADALTDAKGAGSLRATAQVLGTGRQRLIDWLRHRRILLPKEALPYQEHLDLGRFRVAVSVYRDDYGEEHVCRKTLVTGKGLVWLQGLWAADHATERAAS